MSGINRPHGERLVEHEGKERRRYNPGDADEPSVHPFATRSPPAYRPISILITHSPLPETTLSLPLR